MITIPISKQKIEENKQKMTQQLWNQGIIRKKEGALMILSGNHKAAFAYMLTMIYNELQRKEIKNSFEELGVDTEEDYEIGILWEAIDAIIPEFQDIENYRRVYCEERARHGNKTKTQIAEKAYEDAANSRIMETECGCESTEINHIDV
jgi:hypothetical protein